MTPAQRNLRIAALETRHKKLRAGHKWAEAAVVYGELRALKHQRMRADVRKMRRANG